MIFHRASETFRAPGWLILVLLIGACETTGEGPSMVSPVDPPHEPGPFAVGHGTFEITDNDRMLRVDLWYPVSPSAVGDAALTEYPLAPGIGLASALAMDDVPVLPGPQLTLLVFSHGYRGINTQSVFLTEALASHGFLVAAPEHTGNTQSSMGDSFDQAAAHRVPDITLVIDTMMAKSADPEDPFFERMDPGGVGVVGHSFGGMTALGMAAGWAGAPPDDRVTAIAPISAVVDRGEQEDARIGPNAGFSPERLASIEIPVMLLGGTEDVDVPIANNALAFEQLIAAPVVYRIDVLGATHTHFANICAIGQRLMGLGLQPPSWPAIGAEALVGPFEATCAEDAFPMTEATRLTNLYVVAFFKRHLLDQRGYGSYLTAEYAAGETDIIFTMK